MMAEYVLASRGRRLLATLIDFIALPPVALLLMLVSGVLEDAEAWVPPQPFLRILGLLIVSYVLVHGVSLRNAGQTLGKKIMKIQIVASDSGELLPLWKLLLRAFGFGVIGVIPPTFPYLLLLVVISPVSIIGKTRRCLHDYLAGTRVQMMPR